MNKNTPIIPDTLVWLKDHTYPFYFKRINKNGKPVVWGDFSDGLIKDSGAYIESEVDWDDIIYPMPTKESIDRENEALDKRICPICGNHLETIWQHKDWWGIFRSNGIYNQTIRCVKDKEHFQYKTVIYTGLDD